MSGDWIKMQHVTPDKPEVFQMAEILGIDPDAVTGKLVRIWVWADQQTLNGNAVGVTKALLDRISGVTGFCDSLIKVGWCEQTDTGIVFANFAEHNTKTAKTRAVTNKRVAKNRNKPDVTQNVTQGDANCNAATVTESERKALPEKRREEKNNNSLSRGDSFPMDLQWTYNEKNVHDGLRMMGQDPDKLTDGLFGKFKNHYADGQWFSQSQWEQKLRTWVANEKEVTHARKQTSENFNALDQITQ